MAVSLGIIGSTVYVFICMESNLCPFIVSGTDSFKLCFPFRAT